MMVLRSCSAWFMVSVPWFGITCLHELGWTGNSIFSQKCYHIWSEHSLRFCDLCFHDSDSYNYYMHISFYLSFLLWRRFQQDRFSDFREPNRVSSSFTSLSSGISSFPFQWRSLFPNWRSYTNLRIIHLSCLEEAFRLISRFCSVMSDHLSGHYCRLASINVFTMFRLFHRNLFSETLSRQIS